MKLSSLVYAGPIVAMLLFAPKAQASPITYELFGIASGNIGAPAGLPGTGTAFTNAQIHLVATGNTANVVNLSPFFANPFNTFTITITRAGLPDITAAILDPSAIWSADPIPGFNPLPAMLFGRIDNPPNLNGFTGIGFELNSLLAGYHETTGIGPITGTGGIGMNPLCSTFGNDPCLHTSIGLLSFTSNPGLDSGTQTTFIATVALVPEPATLVLLGSGAVMLVGRWRLRARRSAEK